MPNISVIIPLYNSEDYLNQVLESVLKQTLYNIEVICIDDGSNDRSANIVQIIQSQDTRVKYYYQENQGAGEARNNGIKKAIGEYVAFIDSDDEYPDKFTLELLYKKAKANHAKVCGGSMWDERENRSDRQFSKEGFVEFKDFQCDFWFTRFIYKREFLIEENCFFPPYRYYEDPVFLLKVMNQAKSFYAICEPVYKQKESHTFGRSLSLVQLKDYLNGIINNIEISIDNNYNKIFESNIEILEGHFWSETLKCIKSKRADKSLFSLLIKANSLIMSKKEDNDGWLLTDKELIVPMEIIWNTSNKYLRIYNIRILKHIIRIIKKISLLLPLKQNR